MNEQTPHSAQHAAPVVRLEGVRFAYGRVPVLEDVNLSIAPRETVCLVGPNGGGKTTLLRLVLGLLKPQRGRVEVFGRPPHRTRLRIGYMPQHLSFDPLFPVTALDIVLMGRLGRDGLRGRLGWYGRADRTAARRALEAVGMQRRAGRLFAALSGGERQRVLIARALCCEPELLLLDEPTANVDPRFEAQLFDVVKDLKGRMTIVLVSHDLGVVSKWVETVVCVNRRVVVHPTAQLTGRLLQEIYEGEMCMVRHNHVLAAGDQDAGSTGGSTDG